MDLPLTGNDPMALTKMDIEVHQIPLLIFFGVDFVDLKDGRFIQMSNLYNPKGGGRKIGRKISLGGGNVLIMRCDCYHRSVPPKKPGSYPGMGVALGPTKELSIL